MKNLFQECCQKGLHDTEVTLNLACTIYQKQGIKTNKSTGKKKLLVETRTNFGTALPEAI